LAEGSDLLYMTARRLETNTHTQTLREEGIVVVPELIPRSLVDNIYQEFSHRVTARVSFDGAIGTYSSNRLHTFVDLPLTLHPGCIQLATDHRVIDIIDEYLNGESVLSYVFAYQSNVILERRKL